MNKSHKFGHAEDIIREYPENVRLLNERYHAILHDTPIKPETSVSGRGRTGNPTAIKALRLAEDPQIRYLNYATKAVKCALDDMKDDPRCGMIRKMIDLYYWQQTHNLTGVALEINYSSRQVIRLKNWFVRSVMAYLGW
jgi:hypothetical protein